MKSTLLAIAITLGAGMVQAATAEQGTDLLVKFADASSARSFTKKIQTTGTKLETLGSLGGNGTWVRVQSAGNQLRSNNLLNPRVNREVLYVQPNYKIHLLNDYRVQDPVLRAQIIKAHAADVANGKAPAAREMKDNPPIPNSGIGGTGADGQASKQWGMIDNGVSRSWDKARGQGIVTAVIDTGVDYTHEDLVDNMWRNPGETGTDAQGRDKATNGVDDDNNGYIDDVVGWDFVSNDNKPYDLALEGFEIIVKGGNPGHGTHCAGNVGAVANNGKGVVGVAPETKIMALRFLSEKGQGTTAQAIQAINYAVKNGAKVLSNSWGSEGEDPNEGTENQALRDAIQAAQNAGVLFVAAAGNGHGGVGYDNDSDAKPAYPASYNHDVIVSVAATNSTDGLGGFSNWGLKSVDIGAPGVQVFSTTVGSKYSDTVIDMYGIKATWDGTSMATPHVAGAAALYWSANPNATWQDVKNAIMKTAKPISVLNGKSVTGGKLNVEALMKF